MPIEELMPSILPTNLLLHSLAVASFFTFTGFATFRSPWASLTVEACEAMDWAEATPDQRRMDARRPPDAYGAEGRPRG